MYLKKPYLFLSLFLLIFMKNVSSNTKQRINSKFLKEPSGSCSFNKNKDSKLESDKEQCSQSCSSATDRKNENKYLDPEIEYKRITQNEIENDLNDMVLIEEGTFEMGSNDAYFKADREGPVRNVTVKAFLLDKFTVSNEKFSEFVKESSYTSDADKYGNSFVFDQLLPDDEKNIHPDLRAVQAKWWVKLDGATWNHPEGPKSTIEDKMNHPVVHVSWNDANAFCKFYNKRLPTEEEWEKGCRGGLRQKLYPWGNDFMAKKIHRANIWQGEFPLKNTQDDGYFGTCPVDKFPPNNYQLYNMVGNVWEWTSTPAFSHSEVDRIKKGGSFMCHKSYCYRYRCAARSHNTDDSTASNLGFRCAKSV